MSSIPSATDVPIDWRLRVLVLLCAALAQLAGFLLLLGLSLSWTALAGILVIWIFLGWRDWRGQLRAYRSIRAIRPDSNGGFAGIGATGERQQLRLLGGSVLLARIGWLRFCLPDGTRYGELLCGDSRQCPCWHWLQLCWRQRPGRFGDADRS